MAETPDTEPHSSTCEITPQGVLNIHCPLIVPNGEIMAYGVLEKAKQFIGAFLEQVERQRAAEKNAHRIIRPTGSNGGH